MTAEEPTLQEMSRTLHDLSLGQQEMRQAQPDESAPPPLERPRCEGY